MQRTVFFDRDDTLIRCTGLTKSGYLADPALVELMPGAVEACQSLKDAGYKLAVVTNQGGVAKGLYAPHAVEAVHKKVNELLGGMIDAFRYCPYHPEGSVEAYAREHLWRKPHPGMLLDAAQELDVALSESWMVGDAPRDMRAGRSAGCRTVLVVPEHAGAVSTKGADFACRTLAGVTQLILSSSVGEEAAVSPITLRARGGMPLRERLVRDTVIATAQAIAERNGVKLLEIEADDDHVYAQVAAGRLVAIGFAAELRRLTDDWYRAKFGVASLWGRPDSEGSHDGSGLSGGER